jgi:tetraacyldisaccharide 4'-kinase
MRAPDFWNSDGLAARLLSPLGALYGGSVRARQLRAHPFRSKARVVCVGNLTAGGSGKTPIAITLARMLGARRHKVTFLSRGYRGRLSGPIVVDTTRHTAHDVGDEALLLAAVAPTIVSRDRAEGARLADTLGATVIVMDDGFQNFQLAKDVSFVVVDAGAGFGNGRLIPAGPLREPIDQGLSRADAVVMLGDGKVPLSSFEGPVIEAELHPTAPERFAGRSVFAMAGIGRPEKFFRTLQMLGARVVGTRAFPDHHRYTLLEIEAVKQIAANANALLVTTEKDLVRIEPGRRAGILCLPVHAVFADNPNLGMLLDRLAEARA